VKKAIVEGKIKGACEYKDKCRPRMGVFLDGFECVQFFIEGEALEKYRSLLKDANTVRLEGVLRYYGARVDVFEVFKDEWSPEPKTFVENLITVDCRIRYFNTDENKFGLVHFITDMQGLDFIVMAEKCPLDTAWLKEGELIGLRGIYKKPESVFHIHAVEKLNRINEKNKKRINRQYL